MIHFLLTHPSQSKTSAYKLCKLKVHQLTTNCDYVISLKNPRESLRNLGANLHPLSYKWIQTFLTWLTGMPYKGEEITNNSRFYYLASSIAKLGVGVTASAWLWHELTKIIVLQVVPYLVIVGAARDLLPSIAHMCIHCKFTGNRKTDHFISDCITTLLFLQDSEGYFVDHIKKHHNINMFATPEDPDAALLLRLGFHPGLSKEAYWQKLYQTMISPSFHWFFLKRRFLSNYVTATLQRRIMALAWLIIIVTIVIQTNSFSTFIVSWVIPLTFCYHISALCQYCSEHLFFATSGSKSLGRFCGEALPKASFRECPQAWIGWLFRMIFYHLPVRIAVLPGTLPEHDFHHKYPSDSNWMNGKYSRQREIDAGVQGYVDIWGLHNALDYVFEHLSNTPAIFKD